MLFFAIELNLVLWLVLLGNALAKNGGWIWRDGILADGRLIVAGLILSAIIQHWAYYKLRRNAAVQPRPVSPA